jgi:hypothetical protein
MQLLNKINGTGKEFPNDRFIHIYRQSLTREFPNNVSTIDMYVLLLSTAGYLRKIVPGHYSRVKEIPLDIPRSKFERNYLGKMLWTEQVLTFYNLYRDDRDYQCLEEIQNTSV